MEDVTRRGLECRKTINRKASNRNGLGKEILSCCLKAKASTLESDVKCHSSIILVGTINRW
ncbi:Spermine synthase [Spatholobus suberectus]|nr:Spermine synthase [Spatholobus suberectus]